MDEVKKKSLRISFKIVSIVTREDKVKRKRVSKIRSKFNFEEFLFRVREVARDFIKAKLT